MKTVIAYIRKSNLQELKKELPELFDQEDVEIKVLDDKEFDAYVEMKKDD